MPCRSITSIEKRIARSSHAQTRGIPLEFGYRVGMRLGFLCVGALLSSACAADASGAGEGDFMDDDLPMGNCGAGSGTGSCPEDSGNVPAGLPCTVSANCEGELACIAPFIDDDVGDFVCSATCIGLEDEAWWCLDASACCDAAAI